MGYNFREDQINAMYSMYSQSLESLRNHVNGIVNELSSKAGELRYEPVIKMSREAVNYYNESLKQDEIRVMALWQDSDLSFARVMEDQRAGDSAKARSRQLEAKIEDQIKNMQPIDGSSLAGIDTGNWKCEMQDFEDIRDIIENFADCLEDERSQYASMIASLKEENTIYVSIEPVILQTYSIVSEGFRNGVSNGFQELARSFQESEREVQNRANSALQTAASRAQSVVSDSASTIKSKVRTIWE